MIFHRLKNKQKNLLALNLNFPLFEIKAEIGKDRLRYAPAMKAADREDYSKVEDFTAKALRESLEKL